VQNSCRASGGPWRGGSSPTTGCCCGPSWTTSTSWRGPSRRWTRRWSGPSPPFAPQLETIPGVRRTTAATLLAELGADLGVFASAKHLASWAGVCPGNRQSGGRRLSGRTTRGNVWLRGALGEIAWAAIRIRGTSFGDRFRRLARHRGVQKAVVAVIHHLLAVIYAVLTDRTAYRELGEDYLARQDPERAARRNVQQLERLGYRVALSPAT
jgi:transposase